MVAVVADRTMTAIGDSTGAWGRIISAGELSVVVLASG